MIDDCLVLFNVEFLFYGIVWLVIKRIFLIWGYEDVIDEFNIKCFIYGGKLMKKKIWLCNSFLINVIYCFFMFWNLLYRFELWNECMIVEEI